MPRTRFGPAASDDDEQRGGATLAEVLAQRIGHRAKRLEDVGVVRLAADDEQHVGLPSQCLKQMRATSFIFSYGGLPPKSDEMMASSPSISETSEFAPPPKVGARMVPRS